MMTHDQLLAAANCLVPPPAAAAMEYAALADELAAEVSRGLGARADLERLIGLGNREMMEDNHRNHARFITALLQSFNPNVLVETVLWVFRAYRQHGFQLTYWPAQLDLWLKLLRDRLSPEAYAAITPLYRWMLLHQAAFVQLSETAPTSAEPNHRIES